MSKKVDKKVLTKKEFVYCDTRNCPHKQCLRKITNAPFDKRVSVYRYTLDKNGKCVGLLEE